MHLDGSLLDSLWDFSDVDTSLERLRDARDAASGPMRDELSTQVARAHGLGGDFDAGHAELDDIASSDPVVAQRVALERGRLINSDGDPDGAVPLFLAAFQAGADDYCTVDALHMLAIADVDNEAVWTEQALERIAASTDPRVQRWEGRVLNNHAWNLADEGDEEAALEVFREAQEWFEGHGTAQQVHTARWSVAHLLRRLGHADDARALLVQLTDDGINDPFVADELALLD